MGEENSLLTEDIFYQDLGVDLNKGKWNCKDLMIEMYVVEEIDKDDVGRAWK